MCAAAEVPTPSEIAARNDLVTGNQGLVYRVAMGFRDSGIPLEDLAQCGNVGLVCAAERFEPERGLRFSTYATYWIRQAIYKSLTRDSQSIRVPCNTRKQAKVILRRRDAIAAETGTTPSLSAVAAGLDIPAHSRPRLVRAAEVADAKSVGLPHEFASTSAADSESPLSRLVAAEDVARMLAAVEWLRPPLRQILALRYGLDGEACLNRRATSRRLGIPLYLVVRREATALSCLRKRLDTDTEIGGEESP